MVYMPTGGFPTINVLLYAHVGGPPQIKVYNFILVYSWRFKYLNIYIKKRGRKLVSVLYITIKHKFSQ